MAVLLIIAAGAVVAWWIAVYHPLALFVVTGVAFVAYYAHAAGMSPHLEAYGLTVGAFVWLGVWQWLRHLDAKHAANPEGLAFVPAPGPRAWLQRHPRVLRVLVVSFFLACSGLSQTIDRIQHPSRLSYQPPPCKPYLTYLCY